MRDMIEKTISISGMVIEVISDDGERWECRNITTQESLFIDK
ncbi:MAG: hypothetical protein OQK74_06155 [Gammaproteobacteria bacterium]|nr:hypothetical protein [Gammaproteobacteria bacterium]